MTAKAKENERIIPILGTQNEVYVLPNNRMMELTCGNCQTRHSSIIGVMTVVLQRRARVIAVYSRIETKHPVAAIKTGHFPPASHCGNDKNTRMTFEVQRKLKHARKTRRNRTRPTSTQRTSVNSNA